MKKHSHCSTQNRVFCTVDSESKRQYDDQQRQAGVHQHCDVITVESNSSRKISTLVLGKIIGAFLGDVYTTPGAFCDGANRHLSDTECTTFRS